MKILVTGGAGFIGSHTVDRLIQEGHQVVVVDNLSTGKRRHVNRSAVFYKLDIQSSRLDQVFRKERPSLVMHLAAQMNVRRSVEDPVYDAQVNILGTLNLLEQAVRYGARKVVFASSGGAVYGEQGLFPAPESHETRPLSPYGISKLSGEHYLIYYQNVSGLQYVALRYSNVYGPRQDPDGEAGVVAIFSQKMLTGEQPLIYGNGKQTRDFVFVEDVVEANVAVMGQEVQGTYNVGTAQETSVNELFQILAELTGCRWKGIHGPAKKGEQARSVIDFSKLRQEVGWEPKVSLQDGLKRTVEHFRDESARK
jgi:UDP-glucose 4-epimerase